MTRERSSFEAGTHAPDTVNIQTTVESLMTVDTLAKRLAFSRSTLYRLLDAGKVPQPLRIGRSLRWDGRVIEDWLASGCPRPGRPAHGRRA